MMTLGGGLGCAALGDCVGGPGRGRGVGVGLVGVLSCEEERGGAGCDDVVDAGCGDVMGAG